MTIPKTINIMGFEYKVLLKRSPMLKAKGMFDTGSQTIWIDPRVVNKMEVITHEIAEVICAYLHTITDRNSKRVITLPHNPQTGDDAFTLLVINLLDTLQRNKLACW